LFFIPLHTLLNSIFRSCLTSFWSFWFWVLKRENDFFLKHNSTPPPFLCFSPLHRRSMKSSFSWVMQRSVSSAMQSLPTALETTTSLQSSACLLLVCWKQKMSCMLWVTILTTILMSKSSLKESILMKRFGFFWEKVLRFFSVKWVNESRGDDGTFIRSCKYL